MKKKLQINKLYKVLGFHNYQDEKIVRRLLELGFTKGTQFSIAHKSLLGKSVVVELRGYYLTLRTKFLEILKVSDESMC